MYATPFALLLRLGSVVLLIAANGFFVAAEYALVSSRATRLEAMAERGNRLAVLVLRAKQDPNRFISGTQLGITMMTLVIGWIGEETVAEILEPPLRLVPLLGGSRAAIAAHSVAVPIAFALITLLHIVLGEQVPKLIALHHSEAASIVSIQPMRMWGRIFRPFIVLLYWSTSVVLRLLGMRYQGEPAAAHSAEELKLLLASSEALDETEQDIAERAVEFGELAVRQVMVPRTEMQALPAQATLAELIEASLRTGHRRFPIYLHTADHVEGIAHVHDALQAAIKGRDAATIEERLQRVRVDQVMRKVITVPETLSVTRVMAEMRRRRQSAAIVVDEYGGTAGFATWDDILERIVGDVPDEFEPVEPEIQLVPGGALIDGRTLIEDVNDYFDLNIEAEGYDTIAGFVFGQLGRKPDVGDEVQVNGYRFRVEALDGLRIATVRLESPTSPEHVPPPNGVKSEE